MPTYRSDENAALAPQEAAGRDATACRTIHATPSILALDLSLTATGVCMDGVTCTVRPKARGWERIDYIAETIRDYTCEADVVVLEGYSFASNTGRVFERAELGGIVRYDIWVAEVPFVDVPPGTLKKYATGKGNAQKDAMIAAAIRRFGFKGSDNNEADAYLLWCMARHAYGHPVARVPLVQSECVGKVEWPEIRPRKEEP